jgi:hypothetical protein
MMKVEKKQQEECRVRKVAETRREQSQENIKNKRNRAESGK